MKKFLTLMLAALMTFCLFGCSNNGGGEEETSSDETYDIVFLADLGTIYDGGFNQYSFAGIEDYAKEKGLTYTYLQPATDSDEDREIIFKQAADIMQAKILVAVGYLWDTVVDKLADSYPNIQIIFMDSADIPLRSNVAQIVFAEQDCGFLAGYAVVKEGYTELAFMGGVAVPAVVRFGYGFVEGAEYAAKEMGLAPGSINLKYDYADSFANSPELTTEEAAWYEDGTQVLFSCGGTIVNSAIEAAEAAEGRYIVGVDIDESPKSERIITSAMKDLEVSVYDALVAAGKGGADWEAYTSNYTVLTAADGGCTLPDHWERFENFTSEDYHAILDKVATEIHDTLAVESTYETPVEMPLTYVNLSYLHQ